MYLQKIKISNIKCLKSITLDFTSPGTRNDVRRWTALLGQNGLGKSTLLQAIAVPLAGPGAIAELMPVADGWVRQGQAYGEIEATLLWTEGDAQLPKWPKKSPYTIRFLVAGPQPELLPSSLPEAERPTVPSIITWAGDGSGKDREQLNKDLNRLKKTAYAEGKAGWMACGYGPFRRLSGGSQGADRILYSGRLSARFVTLFREDAALTSVTEWLIHLYNTARDGDEQSQRALEIVRSSFTSSLLLEPAEILVTAREARLQFANKSPVPFQSLSDGYRAMLALGIDLMRWLIQSFPESTAPLEQRGIVLVDELDAHLHPRWQQMIGNWLLAKFPNLQFIVATHSPFLAQIASESGGNVVLEEHDGGVQARAEARRVSAWRADQILTELFGLQSTRPPMLQAALEQYVRLIYQRGQRKLTSEERRVVQQLELELGDVEPSLESPEDRRTASLLRSAVLGQRDLLKDLE